MSGAATAIAAVVVVFDSDDSLDACLQRLRLAQDVAQIVVVDNGSRDASISIIEHHVRQDDRLSLVRLRNNPGFAAGCNAGAAGCSSEWLAFVNPDCLVEVDSLRRMRDVAAAIERLGVLGVELIDADGRADPAARRSDPDPIRLLRALGGSAALAVASNGQPVQQVEAISGALMLLPRSAFDAVAGLDTGYRLHAEDLDLCRRLRASGYVVAVANQIRVLHLRGTSSHRRPIWVEWQKHRSLLRYFRRFGSGSRGPGALLIAWLLNLAVWARFAAIAPRAWWRARRRNRPASAR